MFGLVQPSLDIFQGLCALRDHLIIHRFLLPWTSYSFRAGRIAKRLLTHLGDLASPRGHAPLVRGKPGPEAATPGAQSGAIERLCRPIIPKPVLSGLEARDDEMAGLSEVRGRVLVWRRVAAADVTALRTAPQVEPPQTGSKAFDTSRSARNSLRVDAF